MTITIKDFMEITNYRITEGSKYCWQCFGDDAHQLDSWNQNQDGHSISMVFDTKTQEVYTLEAYDYSASNAYRWVNPTYVDAFKKEVSHNGDDNAWDDVKFIDLEVTGDIIKKAKAIVAGVEYDTRIKVEIELDEALLVNLMQIAHEQDITLNQLFEQILRDYIDTIKKETE